MSFFYNVALSWKPAISSGAHPEETTLVPTDPGGETGCAGSEVGCSVSSTVTPSIGVLEGNFDSE